MAFKNLIKFALSLCLCLGCSVGIGASLSAPTFAMSHVPTFTQDTGSGGGGGSNNNSANTGATCPPGSVHAGKTKPTLAQCNLPDENANDALMPRVQMIINVVIGVIGVVAVVVIILGGVTFVTSQGEAAKVTKAKNTILYGIVGLVIALLAFAIVNFVLTGIFSPKP